MLVKIMLLFLLAMIGVAMLGNLLFPGAIGRQVKRRLTQSRPASCPRCGRPRIGKGVCDCTKPPRK